MLPLLSACFPIVILSHVAIEVKAFFLSLSEQALMWSRNHLLGSSFLMLWGVWGCCAEEPAYYVDDVWVFIQASWPSQLFSIACVWLRALRYISYPPQLREKLAVGILPKCSGVGRSRTTAVLWKWVEAVADSWENVAVSSSSSFSFASLYRNVSCPSELLSLAWLHLDRCAF